MWRIINVLIAALFLLAVAVQYNDPDPVRWMLIYLAAAVACVLAVLRRVPWPFPALTAAIAFVWAMTLMPNVIRNGGTSGMFAQWEMADIHVEEAREFFGLLIVVVWMVTVASLSRPGSGRTGSGR